MNSTSQQIFMDFLSLLIYSTEGILLIICNGVLVLCIIRHQALCTLKEYVIIGHLALADALSGLGTLCAGIYRIPKVLDQSGIQLASRHQCFLAPQNFILTLAGPLAGIMLLVVSFDRFLSVTFPLRYLCLTRRYALTLVTIAYGYCTIQAVIFGIRVWSHTELDQNYICMLGSALVPIDYSIWWNKMTGASFASIGLYIAVLLCYKHRRSQGRIGNRETELRLRRQNRFTKTVALSCFCTAAFYGVPTIIGNLSYLMDINYNTVVTWVWIIANINPLMNIFIFLKRQREIRMGVRALFQCKVMPPNFESWVLNSRSMGSNRSKALSNSISRSYPKTSSSVKWHSEYQKESSHLKLSKCESSPTEHKFKRSY